MKILQINNFHYIRGGSDRVYIETSKLLKEKGHDVLFFSSKNNRNIKTKYEKYFVENIEYQENIKKSIFTKINSAKKFLYNKEAVQKLDNLIKDEKPDIAHLHIFQSRLSSHIIKVLHRQEIPTVMSVHEYKMLCPVYSFLNNIKKICEKCASKNYLNAIVYKCNNGSWTTSALSALECFIRDKFASYERHIDHFIMVSDFIKKKHIQYIPIFSQKSTLLYNFIDLNKFQPSFHKDKYYLYFGRLSKEKGILTLLKSANKIPNLKFIIVGEGPQKDEITHFIKKDNIINVQLFGYKSGDELKNLIQNSKFVIVPSEWYENNPLSILESQALGTPVIGAMIGGIPELIKHNENGYLFESGNIKKLVGCIKNAEQLSDKEYQNMSRAARFFAEEKYDKEEYYSKLIEIYKKAIINKSDCTVR